MCACFGAVVCHCCCLFVLLSLPLLPSVFLAVCFSSICLSASLSVSPYGRSVCLCLFICLSRVLVFMFASLVFLSNSVSACLSISLFGCRSGSLFSLPCRTIRQAQTCPPRLPVARGPPPVGGSEVWKAPRWTQLTHLCLASLISEPSRLVRPVGRATREGGPFTSVGHSRFGVRVVVGVVRERCCSCTWQYVLL